MDDDRLIRRIKAGDADAWDAMIRGHYDDIYRYCFRRLGRKSDAQDAAQEVFLHFCRNFDSYAHRGKCLNYLYVIARNLCINMMRKKVPLPLDDPDKVMSPVPDAVNDNAAAIRAAVDSLPEEQKEVVILRFYHDLRLKTIAGIMGSGLSITKYRLYQGLKSLSASLSKEDRS